MSQTTNGTGVTSNPESLMGLTEDEQEMVLWFTARFVELEVQREQGLPTVPIGQEHGDVKALKVLIRATGVRGDVSFPGDK